MNKIRCSAKNCNYKKQIPELKNTITEELLRKMEREIQLCRRNNQRPGR